MKFKKPVDVALWPRFPEQIPLAEAAALARQPIEVFGGLNSFGGGMQAEAMPQPYDRVDDFGIFGTQGAGATILVLGVLSLVMLGMIRGVRR